MGVLLGINLTSCSKEEIQPGNGDDKIEHPNGIPSKIPTNTIYYTTNDNIIIRFENEDVFGGAKIVSNTYSSTKGYGTIEFSSEVTGIETNAFREEETLTYIALPNSVKSIGERAFSDCSALTSVFIPNSVTSIGKKAFDHCYALTSVHISDLVAWCNIKFNYDDDSNPLGYAQHLYLNGEEVKNLVIPNSVTNIGQFVFFGCSALSVTIPNSVKSIGDYAFLACTGLTSVTIPNSVTSIAKSAFEDCTGLTTVTIGNSVESIGNNAFERCPINACYSYATTPPSVHDDSFDKKEGILYVPEKSLDAYINSNWVNNFRYIAKIENPDDIYEYLTVAEKAEGEYTLERITNMDYLPAGVSFTPITNTVQLNIKAEDDNSVNITIPSTTFNISDTQMSIPEMTIENIPVVDDLNNGVSIPEYRFTQYGDKRIEGMLAGVIKADGNLHIAIIYVYGNMPFAIRQDFIINTEN